MLLVADNIQKSYGSQNKKLHVLKGINLHIEKGDALAIVGPSGAGKSTLLHVLGGLDEPDDGQVLIDGSDIYKYSDKKRAKLRNKDIGFVFQFYHLLPEFSALENVVLPALIREDTSQIKRFEPRGCDLLKMVGLLDRKTHKPSELSGGEQQRVAIARALMNDPQIIFCDEPTGNLDSASGQNILNILLKLNQEVKTTLVLVTHDEKIAQLADKVIELVDGIIKESVAI